MLKDEYKIYEEKMSKSIDSAAADFASVRAGRANAAVLDRITVDYYGTPTPIQQIAAISTPDPRILQISPWDNSALKSIEKAIRSGAGNLLEQAELFDIYKGKQIPDGKKSVAYNITMRSADRTLTDEDIEKAMNRMLKNLSDLGVSIRG